AKHGGACSFWAMLLHCDRLRLHSQVVSATGHERRHEGGPVERPAPSGRSRPRLRGATAAADLAAHHDEPDKGVEAGFSFPAYLTGFGGVRYFARKRYTSARDSFASLVSRRLK